MTREINEGERTGARQRWRTARALARLLAARFGYDLDAMALPWNAVVPRFIGPPLWRLRFDYGAPRHSVFTLPRDRPWFGAGAVAIDALAVHWAHFGRRIFVNPEFAIIERVVYRMIEAAREGAWCQMLAPDNGDTKWFRALADAGARVRRFASVDGRSGRVPFEPEDETIAKSTPGFPCALYELDAFPRPRPAGAIVPTFLINPMTCEDV